MENESKTSKNGSRITVLGALIAVSSFVIDDTTWTLVVAGIGVVVVFYGGYLTEKGKGKKEKG